MTALPFTPDQLVATFCLDHSVQEYAKAFRGTLNAEGEVELAPPVRARIQASLLMVRSTFAPSTLTPAQADQ